LQTSNPAFSQTFAQNFDYADARSTTMTVQGTAMKSFVLLAIVMFTAAFSWIQTEQDPSLIGPLRIGSLLGAMVFFFMTVFKPTWAAWTSPLYAAFEGVFLGMISRLVELRYPGIAIQAVGLTCAVTFVMLFIYVTGIIKVTGQLVTGIVAATGGIALLYMATYVLGFFGIRIPFIFEAGPIGIAFSVFVVGLAAFNLLLDFDYIDRGAQAGLSKRMEWYGAFGLMVTLIWLYLEVLQLLAKLNSRR
jgi:uncharacterized YccA/Bax inhibitor family protein